MIDELTRERLAHWVADFTESDATAPLPAGVGEHAHAMLHAWLVAACERRHVEPEDLEREDLRDALLEHVARLDLPEPVHRQVPALARDLLASLEEAGRLADGRELGLFVAALRPSYERAARGEPEPLARPGAKIGRNDPCPCGSGKKFKRCCMVR